MMAARVAPAISDDDHWRRFITLTIVTAVVAFAIVAGVMIAVFARAGEFWPARRVIETQMSAGGLYRASSRDMALAPEHKLERFRILNPVVAALGSSRVLQFRQDHFRAPFANMGMWLDHTEFPEVAQTMTRTGDRLCLVILAIDFWQFHPRYNGPSRYRATDTATTRILAYGDRLSQVFVAPVNFFANSSKAGLAEIERLVWRRDRATGQKIPEIGVAAILDGAGIDVDGSLHYTNYFEPPGTPGDGLRAALGGVARREQSFKFGDRVSPERWQKFIRTIDVLRSAGAATVLIIPPVAGAIAQAMERQPDAYRNIATLREMAAQVGVPFFDFHDPRRFGSSDCEFADATHGGEVTYLRMLAIMAGDPNSRIAKHIDLDKIEALVSAHAGKVNAYVEPRAGDRRRREQDLLGLGCRKN